MENLPALKGQLNSWNGNAQTMKARELGGPVLPATTSVEPGLVLLDATVTGTKAKDLETKLHRLLVQPLSNLMATGQIQSHDQIRVTHHGESPSLTFFREAGAWESWKTNGAAAA
jgi:hypothetical protein